MYYANKMNIYTFLLNKYLYLVYFTSIKSLAA